MNAKTRMIRQLMLQGIDEKTAETTAAEIIAWEVARILARAQAATTPEKQA